VGTAATGTGKTAAFVVPLLEKLTRSDVKSGETKALIITPTRELAEQILQVIRKLSRHMHVRSAVVYGGVGFEPQRKALQDGTEIIVCCPGRMLDLIQQGATRLKSVETLILDEADRMLDMGFLPTIRKILAALPQERQTLLFSATFEKELMDLIRHELKHPKHVSVASDSPAETIDHCFYPVPSHLKTDLLLGLLKSMDSQSVLVFTRTKHRANRVMEKLSKSGYMAGVLHANKSQNQRQLAMEGFRSGRIKILVATDIAARGLDIATISHVINYDIPDTATAYIHRIGRTGRAERSGDAITFISDEDKNEVRDIERRLGSPVLRKRLEGFDYQQAKKADAFQRDSARRFSHPHHSQSGFRHSSRDERSGSKQNSRGNRAGQAYRRGPAGF
jgi:ATP-dependent RNA helicase RhlE